MFSVLVWCLTLAGTVQAASLPDFTELVEDASPGVVNISASRSSASPAGYGGSPDLQQIPEFFRHFFGDQLPGPGGNAPMPRQMQSTGSGFIVSADGIVLTNNHVVEGADEIIVRLADRRELVAELVGTDPDTDLAVLKVKADDLPVLKLGKSSKLKVGEWVLAIGSPFGFDYTVTAGIVSALARSLPSENYVPFIQTDVAINPGNSGGPLFNLDGEVVGINSQIYTRSGGFMGVSFAIPIDVAMNVVEQIRETGQVRRGWLGVLIQEVNRDLAESFGLSKPHGALVAQVMPESPAAKAGLKPGDVILSFEDDEINLSSELPHRVGRVKPGTEAEMEIIRAGKRQTLDIIVGQVPGSDEVAAAPSAKPSADSNTLGMEVRDLTSQEKAQLQLSGGVVVTNVMTGPAAAAGIRAGDVISTLNNERVNSVSDLRAIASKLPSDKSIPVLIVRNGNPAFVVMRIED
ncbi:DegQ family serine endoprotease [Allohahella marinimesophila]|uniref:Probable periplasmic serine endoprotease DegP-like n=1 Tax=Allohahella marinimesophila TaxID=1054972 RepID=A0ABP7Q4R2_9GAMM